MEFPARLEHLPDMLQFILNQAEKLSVSKDRRYKLELASEEALVNIISYAYKDQKTGIIRIDCEKLGDNRLEIVIRDHGFPFNPIDADIRVDTEQPIDERKIGGLGIFLMRKILDEVSYQRIGEENVLRLLMNIH